MGIDSFGALCRRAGITKAELARRFDYSPSTVYHWTVAPQFAVAYLELLIELNTYKAWAEMKR